MQYLKQKSDGSRVPVSFEVHQVDELGDPTYQQIIAYGQIIIYRLLGEVSHMPVEKPLRWGGQKQQQNLWGI